MVVGDTQGRLTYANQRATARLAGPGQGASDLAGRPVVSLLAARGADATDAVSLPGGALLWCLLSDLPRHEGDEGGPGRGEARSPEVELRRARFAAETSDVLAGLRSALLPSALPAIEGVRLGAAYRPAQETTEIGGDFYEIHADQGGWSFTLGDVCGKGVEAAVLSGQVRQSLRTVSLVKPDPVERLGLLNSALLSTDGTSFVTLVHGVMKPVDGGVAVHVAAGGHPAPLLRRRDGRVEEVEARGPIIGMLSEVHFTPAELVLARGETLLCFTDGLPDAKGPGGFLGVEAMTEVLADCAGMTAQAIADRILQTALEHLGGHTHDDMAILAMQVDPPAAEPSAVC